MPTQPIDVSYKNINIRGCPAQKTSQCIDILDAKATGTTKQTTRSDSPHLLDDTDPIEKTTATTSNKTATTTSPRELNFHTNLWS